MKLTFQRMTKDGEKPVLSFFEEDVLRIEPMNQKRTGKEASETFVTAMLFLKAETQVLRTDKVNYAGRAYPFLSFGYIYNLANVLTHIEAEI